MNSIKFSYYFGCRERVISREYDNLFAFLKSEGYEAIELLELYNEEQIFNSESEACEFADLLKLNNISVSCHSVYVDVFESIEFSENYLKKQVDIASIIGSPYLHHTIKPQLEITSEKEDVDDLIAKVLPVLKNVADYAKSKGIKLLYEPQGMYFNGEGLKKPINAFVENGVENVGVCIDFGNTMFVDYTPMQIIADLMPYVCHAHIKDYKLCAEGEGDYRSAAGQSFYEVGYGRGDMKNSECLKALLCAGYDGYFSTELTPRGVEADDAGVDAIAKIRKFFS